MRRWLARLISITAPLAYNISKHCIWGV